MSENYPINKKCSKTNIHLTIHNYDILKIYLDFRMRGRKEKTHMDVLLGLNEKLLFYSLRLRTKIEF